MKRALLCAVLIAASSSATAGEFSLGVVTSYSPAVYKGADSEVVPFPLLGYEGEHLYLRGTEAGYRLLKSGSDLNVIFRVAYDPRTLKPSDSDDVDIQMLDERKAGGLAGVTLESNTEFGIFQATAGTAITNDNTGVYAEVLYKKLFNMGRFGFAPEIGYAYNDSELNNRLYGVSAEEAARTNFEQFDADASGRMFVGAESYLYVTKDIRVTASIRYTKLDSKLADSPIIDNDNSVTGTLGAAYIF
jgi:MipA family protein